MMSWGCFSEAYGWFDHVDQNPDQILEFGREIMPASEAAVKHVSVTPHLYYSEAESLEELLVPLMGALKSAFEAVDNGFCIRGIVFDCDKCESIRSVDIGSMARPNAFLARALAVSRTEVG